MSMSCVKYIYNGTLRKKCVVINRFEFEMRTIISSKLIYFIYCQLQSKFSKFAKYIYFNSLRLIGNKSDEGLKDF